MDPMEAIRQSMPEHDPQFQTLAQHMRNNQSKPLPSQPEKDPSPESSVKPSLSTVESNDPEQPLTATPPPEPSLQEEFDEEMINHLPPLPDIQGTEQPLNKEEIKEKIREMKHQAVVEMEEELLPLNQPVPEPQLETVNDPSASLEEVSVVPETTLTVDEARKHGEKTVTPYVKNGEYMVEAELEENYGLIRSIREYCSPHSVAMVMKYMCEKSPETFPRFTAWDCDVKEPPTIVYAKLMSEGYIKSIFPIVKMMLSTSIHNISWAARVTIAVAVYDTVRDLARMGA